MDAPTQVSETTQGTPAPNPVPAAPASTSVEFQRSPYKHFLFVLDNYVRYVLSKSLVIILTVYSFYALWESVLFATVEYPELQQSFAAGELTSLELDHAIAGAMLRVMATVISTILAIRLTTVQEKVAHTTDIIITTALILGHNFFMDYLLSHNLVQVVRKFIPF